MPTALLLVAAAFASEPAAPAAPADPAPAPAPAPAPVAASPAPVVHHTLERDPVGIGLGAALGLPTGLSASWRPKLSGAWVQGGFGWDFSTGTIATGADVLYTLSTLHAPDIEEFSFPLYVGIGPRFRLGDAASAYAPPIFALRLPIGMAFYHDKVPVEGYFEAAPGIGVIPRVRGTFDAVIGGRFYLP